MKGKDIDRMEFTIGMFLGVVAFVSVGEALGMADYSVVTESVLRWFLSAVGICGLYLWKGFRHAIQAGVGKLWLYLYSDVNIITFIAMGRVHWLLNIEEKAKSYTWGTTVFFGILIPATLGFFKGRENNHRTETLHKSMSLNDTDRTGG